MAFYWTCPTCGTHTTIMATNECKQSLSFACKATPQSKAIRLAGHLIECPNTSCRAQAFEVVVNHATLSRDNLHVIQVEAPLGVGGFTFAPTTAKPLSPHVPAQVAEDYNEAYLIKSLSPKASATLARRALQGMVRDFFQVTDKRTLHAELEAIKEKCDDELYAAMMAVKSIGNIGAHPEKDASLMVDVEPGEAETLLDLIHLLDHEWYVSRAQKAARIAKVRALSEQKERALDVLKGPPEPA